MTNIPIFVEDRRNTGTSPNVTVQLPFDKKSHQFKTLAKAPTDSKALTAATHLSFNAPNGVPQGTVVHIEGGPATDHGAGNKIDLHTGAAPYEISGGNPVDISSWWVTA